MADFTDKETGRVAFQLRKADGPLPGSRSLLPDMLRKNAKF
jgi:hypothetical protein